MKPSLLKTSQKGFLYHLLLCVATTENGDRNALESVTGIEWNQWPGLNGMGGRNGTESMAGIVWNMQLLRKNLNKKITAEQGA
jgi:hypothetical protein